MQATDVLPTYLEIAYRKPCFAGDLMRIDLAAFEQAGASGALGCFVPSDEPPHSDPEAARPHATVRMLFGATGG